MNLGFTSKKASHYLLDSDDFREYKKKCNGLHVGKEELKMKSQGIQENGIHKAAEEDNILRIIVKRKLRSK